MGSTECTSEGPLPLILIDCLFLFSMLMLKVSSLAPLTISWKTIPGVIFNEPPPATLSILSSKLSHLKIVGTYERSGNE